MTTRYFTTAPEVYDYDYVTTVASGIKDTMRGHEWRLVEVSDLDRFRNYQMPRYFSGLFGCFEEGSENALSFGLEAPETETTRDLTRDHEIALLMLEAHGSTSYPPEKWHGWSYAITDYAPEWLTEVDADQCVTVLDFSLSAPEAPEGYRVVRQYAAGEKSCPWCGDGTGEESRRDQCALCEGEGLLYWGEECQVVVFQKEGDSE